jgi:hypothetical protein
VIKKPVPVCRNGALAFYQIAPSLREMAPFFRPSYELLERLSDDGSYFPPNEFTVDLMHVRDNSVALLPLVEGLRHVFHIGTTVFAHRKEERAQVASWPYEIAPHIRSTRDSCAPIASFV